MKKIRKLSSLFLVMILSLAFLAGCTSSKKATKSNPKPEEKPSFQELIKAFKNVDINHYTGTLKEHFADLSEIEISDLSAFKDQIGVVYGSVRLPEVDTVYKSIADLGRLTSYSSTTMGKNDAIIIIKNASLNKTENNRTKTEKINIVALQGTDFSEGQATGLKEDLLSGLECNNYYLYDAFLAITNNIPKGSTLYITGLSLGGMVAQQLAGVKYLQSNYNVKYVAAIGSPLVAPENINYNKTNVSRFVIENDIVPTLSNSATEIIKKENLVVEGAGVYKSFIGAHVFGYVNDDIWGKYDVLGVKDGNATISFENHDSIALYPASNTNVNKK